MKVSKERLSEVIEAMKENALHAFSSGSSSKYSFESFCKENRVINGRVEHRGNDVLISCPFHSDSTPSCHLNDSMWAYNCFGCKGGSFLDFRYRYLTEILGEEIGWSQMVDKMLREDTALSIRLGYSTIYVKTEKSITEMTFLPQTRFKANKQMPKTYLEMLDRFLKTNPSIEKKKLFITLMQRDIPVKDAWNEFFAEQVNEKAEINSPKRQYDLEELNKF